MTDPTQTNLTATFLRATREMLLDQSWPRLRTCVESLTDEQIWWRPNTSSNSIGNLMLHLNGNVTQWIITSFTRAGDRRDRPAEFSRKDGISRDELIRTLSATMQRVSEVLTQITDADLIPSRSRATTRPASRPFTMSLSISPCITGRSPMSRRCSAMRTLVFIGN